MKCSDCIYYAVKLDLSIYPAPSVRGVWISGCRKRGIRFGTFAEEAAGEGRNPESCESFKDSDIDNAALTGGEAVQVESTVMKHKSERD